MNRFFIKPLDIQNDLVHFSTEVTHQITKVLRLKSGEKVIVLDNSGDEYIVQLGEPVGKQTTGHVLSKQKNVSEPEVDLTLFVALTQREKFEWILQKGCEIGVSKFVPVVTERSLVREKGDNPSKTQRWETIVREAAEQCERGKLPVITPVMDFPNALRIAKVGADASFLAWERDGGVPIVSALHTMQEEKNRAQNLRISLFVGPEGGYSPSEVAQAKEAGLTLVSLGKRILRMETAAIAAAAIILTECEENLA